MSLMRPSFGKDALKALAGAKSFARGREYAASGVVFGLVRRGNLVAAQVEGSEVTPYHVSIELRDGGIATTACSCPYDWGGICKHVVAVALTLLESPDAVVERPSLEELLGSLDRDSLAALLVKRARSDIGLVAWLETELAAPAPNGPLARLSRADVDPEAIRRQVHRLLTGHHSRRRGWDDDFDAVDEDALAELIDKARPYVEAGEGRNALSILEPVTDVLMQAWLERVDWDETLHEFFPVLGQLVAEAVLTVDLSQDEREGLIAKLEVWQGEIDDYGMDDHFQVALDALEKGWDEAGLKDVLAGNRRRWPLAGGSNWTVDRLTDARLKVLAIGERTQEYLNLAAAAARHGDHAVMLVRLGRFDDAMGYAHARFQSPEHVLLVSRALYESGQTGAALALAQWGLSLKAEDAPPFGNGRLARWLRDHAAAVGMADIACTAAEATFRQTLSREDFRAAEAVAGTAWPELRRRLLAALAETPHAHDRTEIFLEEGMLGDAVRSVDVGHHLRSPTNTVLLRLADAAHSSHPDWVIDLCERMAEGIIDTGQAGLYQQAAEWLEKAALAYDSADRFEEWLTRLDGLLAKHRRKHKLRPLLEALRPGA